MKYIVTWNAGFGEEFAVVECEDKEVAKECAKELCMEEVECNVAYAVVGEATEDLCEEHDLDIDDIAN